MVEDAIVSTEDTTVLLPEPEVWRSGRHRKRSSEQEAEIERLWCVEHRSSAEIAALTGLTRSAVCGLANRRGWMNGGSVKKARAVINRVARNLKTLHARPAPCHARGGFKHAPRPLPEPESVTPLNVHIVDLEAHHCRFVMGDPKAFTYCGARKVEGSAYCAHHKVGLYITRAESERRLRSLERAAVVLPPVTKYGYGNSSKRQTDR